MRLLYRIIQNIVLSAVALFAIAYIDFTNHLVDDLNNSGEILFVMSYFAIFIISSLLYQYLKIDKVKPASQNASKNPDDIMNLLKPVTRYVIIAITAFIASYATAWIFTDALPDIKRAAQEKYEKSHPTPFQQAKNQLAEIQQLNESLGNRLNRLTETLTGLYAEKSKLEKQFREIAPQFNSLQDVLGNKIAKDKLELIQKTMSIISSVEKEIYLIKDSRTKLWRMSQNLESQINIYVLTSKADIDSKVIDQLNSVIKEQLIETKKIMDFNRDQHDVIPLQQIWDEQKGKNPQVEQTNDSPAWRRFQRLHGQ